jgi:hypothetical protein
MYTPIGANTILDSGSVHDGIKPAPYANEQPSHTLK